jgi:hypothetical protein
MRRRVTLWFSRVTNSFRSSRLDRELEDEIRFHLEARTEELVRQGMTLRESGRAARRQLGNSPALCERSRDVKLLPRVESLWQDVRFGLRVLRKYRAVTAAAVLSLALAIGASTAAFALVDALSWRPLRFTSRSG